MKRILYLSTFVFLCITKVSAQTIDILSEDMLIGNATTPTEQTSSDSSSIFSFITKPLSLIFSAEDEVQTDTGKKETFLEKSIRQANEGKLEDQMNLGYMYLYGTNGVEQNFDNALKYYTMAAEQKDPIALNNLGSLYFNGIGVPINTTKALDFFQQSAELGNDNAALNLAFIYLTGGKKDSFRNSQAIKMFQASSQNGNKIAKFMLGYAYYKGFVVDKDYEKAFKLIRSATEEDSNIDEAHLTLAKMYIEGHGTVQNYNNGIRNYRIAVNQGNVEAYMILANIYTIGKIVPMNLTMAHSLYNIAASLGESGAAEKRDAIGKKLQLEELLKAQSDAQNFKANPSELTSYIRQTYGNNIRNYIDINIP